MSKTKRAKVVRAKYIKRWLVVDKDGDDCGAVAWPRWEQANKKVAELTVWAPEGVPYSAVTLTGTLPHKKGAKKPKLAQQEKAHG